jgi:hypothetical protein
MQKIKENEMGDRMMTGLPYSQGGGIGSSGLDTISSPDISQTPEKFKYPQTAASASDISTPPPGDYDNSPQPQDRQNYEADVDAIKFIVTPDEILAGMQYELNKMVFKRKDTAKQLVVANLRRDPKFYSKLHMMQIDENGVRKEAIYDIIREMKNKKHVRNL